MSTRPDPYKGFNFIVRMDSAEAAMAEDAFFVKVDAETTTASADVVPADQLTLNYTEVKPSQAETDADEFDFAPMPDATDPTLEIGIEWEYKPLDDKNLLRPEAEARDLAPQPDATDPVLDSGLNFEAIEYATTAMGHSDF